MQKKSVRNQVVEMEVGQSILFPVTEIGYSTIRTYASELGFLYGRSYSTACDKKQRVFTITRNA